MHPNHFRELQKKFRQEGLLEVSNAKGAATVALEIVISLTIALTLGRIPTWGVWFWLLQAMASVSIFRWFVILHECGHKTLFSKAGVNTMVGHIASVFCLIPYMSWRHVHLQHHRWVGVIDKDPTQKHLLKLEQTSATQNQLFRLVWKLWLPIPFAKFLFEVFWGYPLVCAREGRTKEAWQCAASVAVCLFGQLALITVLGVRGWASYFLPMLVFFYVLIENMNLPQHSELFPYLSSTHPNPIPFCEQDAVTRSTHLPDWISTVLALNFNRHTEHHLFVAAPWYSLNKVRRRLLSSGYQLPHEVKFVRFMWQLRQRDPLQVYRDALPKAKETLQ